jgi:TPP-dependent pyruvate/acetoin dehydrogenase alpha subunit
MDRDTAIWIYRTMATIRAFEEKAIELMVGGELPGFIHPSLGQEASSAGTCANLRRDDYIITTHRPHGDVIAKGAPLNKIAAELMAKETGLCRGKAGSMHLCDLTSGVLVSSGVVGGGLPAINGVGLAAKLRGTDQVGVAFFSDGASNQGMFHETLNMASLWSLPVVFVCNNNRYAESTPQRNHQRIEDISARAVAYGMPGVTVDGTDAVAVYEAARTAVERAREGEGPTLIECKLRRWSGHYVGDPAPYRAEEEKHSWKQADPVAKFEEWLVGQSKATRADLTAIRAEVAAEVEEAVKFARQSAATAAEEGGRDVYA